MIAGIPQALKLFLGLEEEANQLFLIAEAALNRTIETNRTITAIEEGLEDISEAIDQTERNVMEASSALDTAEGKCKHYRINEIPEYLWSNIDLVVLL